MPLLREGITESTFEFFISHILVWALKCNENWHKYRATNEKRLAHVNELLCSQLWGLFPGFCRKPRDIKNIKILGRDYLVKALTDTVNLRAPILDGLKELLTNADDDGKRVLGMFARNFIPVLCNVYSTKPNGTYESELRTKTMEVIIEYLKIAPSDVLAQTFVNAKNEHKKKEELGDSFASESIFDIIEHLAVYQSSEELKQLFDDVIVKVLQQKMKKSIEKLKKQQRKAYQLLLNILTASTEGSAEFIEENFEQIKNLILKSLKTTCNTTQAARLK